MGYLDERRSRRITRTVDGGYLYAGVVFRQAATGWRVDLPDGRSVNTRSQESARRAIDSYLAGESA